MTTKAELKHIEHQAKMFIDYCSRAFPVHTGVTIYSNPAPVEDVKDGEYSYLLNLEFKGTLVGYFRHYDENGVMIIELTYDHMRFPAVDGQDMRSSIIHIQKLMNQDGFNHSWSGKGVWDDDQDLHAKTYRILFVYREGIEDVCEDLDMTEEELRAIPKVNEIIGMWEDINKLPTHIREETFEEMPII